jgi:hypothetical protein
MRLKVQLQLQNTRSGISHFFYVIIPVLFLDDVLGPEYDISEIEGENSISDSGIVEVMIARYRARCI